MWGFKQPESEFWERSPDLGNNYRETDVKTDSEELYEWQCDKLASAILVKDFSPHLQVNEWDVHCKAKIKWINKGELIAGSSIANDVAKYLNTAGFDVDDIDIYFKSKDDVILFCKINGFQVDLDSLPEDRICTKFNISTVKLNFIWGVEYESPEHLVSKFDIRACSMALDPSNGKMWAVNGALHDAMQKEIVWNPVPRHTSVQRLVKYIDKKFTIGKYQRLFFAELIRSDIYSKQIGLTTGYEVKSPR